MPLPLPRLLWLDCTAAAVGGTAMLLLAGLLAPLLGLPRGLIAFNGCVNLAYGAFSFTLARQPSPPLSRVNALVVANFAWAGVCLLAALYFARRGTWLGAAYLAGEALVVGALAAIEARTLRAAAAGATPMR